MSIWYTAVVRALHESGLFSDVQLAGGKVRAFISPTIFLDVHYDPAAKSYSYAVIDLTLPYPGDKRLFGWDDFPHPDSPTLTSMAGYPHHFQDRRIDGTWNFTESAFRGNVEDEIHEVIRVIQQKQITQGG